MGNDDQILMRERRPASAPWNHLKKKDFPSLGLFFQSTGMPPCVNTDAPPAKPSRPRPAACPMALFFQIAWDASCDKHGAPPTGPVRLSPASPPAPRRLPVALFFQIVWNGPCNKHDAPHRTTRRLLCTSCIKKTREFPESWVRFFKTSKTPPVYQHDAPPRPSRLHPAACRLARASCLPTAPQHPLTIPKTRSPSGFWLLDSFRLPYNGETSND